MDISLRRPAPEVSVMSTCCKKKTTKTNDVNAILRNKCTFGGKMSRKLLWTGHCEVVKGTREISAGNCAAKSTGW